MANAGSRGFYENIDDPMVAIIDAAASADTTWVEE